MDEWLDETTMQSIAEENNLSETAFFVRQGDRYNLRWFTPVSEVDLCGHATLATSFVIFNYLNTSLSLIEFETKSGLLKVEKSGDLISLDFPARRAVRTEMSDILIKALGAQPVELHQAVGFLAVFESESQIRSLKPDFEKLKNVEDGGNVIVTAPGVEVDFVSRFFAPNLGIPEDPVTGAAHTTLIPYWAERLKKKNLHALQVSHRGGELWCEDRGDRVKMSGKAILYSRGTVYL